MTINGGCVHLRGYLELCFTLLVLLVGNLAPFQSRLHKLGLCGCVD